MVERSRRAPGALIRLGRAARACGSLGSQFAAYGAAAGIAAATHVGVLAGLAELADLPKALASGIGFCCAIPVNYMLQHRYVFASKSAHRKVFFRYVAVTVATLGLNVALFHVMLKTVSIHYIAGQIIVIGVVFVLNFMVNRTYTFAATQA